jgi:hypothetical protein
MRWTFDYIESEYLKVQTLGYEFLTCHEYISWKKNERKNKIVVNRVDIDFSVKKTKTLVDIFNKLGIKATFFLRLHAPEYNPFSFENYKIIKHLLESGHELGYHSEVVDQSAIWNEDPSACLVKDIQIINTIFNTRVKGVASHGGSTGLNNLDFWREKRASDFGLAYEVYDKEPEFNLFHESIYVSDSEWTRWKCYDKGKLVEGDKRSISEHAIDNHKILHFLIHPDTYYFEHFYE